MHSKKAFTLAEVLITLAIIGVVAALTIPTLIKNFQDAQYKTAYKKAYSVASQAWTTAVTNNEIEARPSWTDDQSKVDNFNAFESHFKVTKDCNSSNNSDCWNSGGEVFYGNYPISTAHAFIDNSGMAWSLTANSGTGAEILVDTNGFKLPNKYGQDRFILNPKSENIVNAANTTYPEYPIVIRPVVNDYTSKDSLLCPSGDSHPCYYKSWLLGSN